MEAVNSQTLIRAAAEADLTEITRLEQLCFNPPWTEAMLARELQSPDARVLVAETQGSFAGFALFHRAGDQAELYQIAVCGESRRRGIASALLEAGEEACLDLACNSVYLEVRRSNQPAIGLYSAHAYTQVGVRKKYYINPVEDAFLFVKELNV